MADDKKIIFSMVGVYSYTSDRNTFRGLTVEKAGKVLLQQAKE